MDENSAFTRPRKKPDPLPSVTKSLFLMCLINAMEGHQLVTCDVPGAFMQADIGKILLIKLVGEIPDNL